MSAPDFYVGLMSGTSLDGVDAVLGDFSDNRIELRATHFLPFEVEFRSRLFMLQRPAGNELDSAARCANDLARQSAEAVNRLLKASGISRDRVTAIGCHGQTVRHHPDLGYTLQINNPALLAELSGIAVVADFRSRDVAAGGQGAPLVPAFHLAAFGHAKIHRVIVNIGGIANLTDIAPRGPITGFDTGPGNALMDAWIELQRGEAFDRDGAWAAGGKVLPEILALLAGHEYFRKAPPKSTGRETFGLEWASSVLSGTEAPQDVQATLLALTADTVAAAVSRYCPGAKEVYLCGGGAHNRALVRRLSQGLSGVRVGATDELGIGANWVEAMAFAWLARQTLRGEPGNLPDVTGAKGPRVLGAIYPK